MWRITLHQNISIAEEHGTCLDLSGHTINGIGAAAVAQTLELTVTHNGKTLVLDTDQTGWMAASFLRVKSFS